MQPFYKSSTCTLHVLTDWLGKHHSYEQDIPSHLPQTVKIQIKAIKFRKREKKNTAQDNCNG